MRVFFPLADAINSSLARIRAIRSIRVYHDAINLSLARIMRSIRVFHDVIDWRIDSERPRMNHSDMIGTPMLALERYWAVRMGATKSIHHGACFGKHKGSTAAYGLDGHATDKGMTLSQDLQAVKPLPNPISRLWRRLGAQKQQKNHKNEAAGAGGNSRTWKCACMSLKWANAAKLKARASETEATCICAPSVRSQCS